MYQPDPDPIYVLLQTIFVVCFWVIIILSWIYVVFIDPILDRMGVEPNGNVQESVSEDSSCLSESD